MSVNTPQARWIRLFAALLALSLIAGIIPVYASDGDQMHVEIHVTDEDGQPVPGIRIKLAGTSSIGEPVSMTDETGSGGVAIFDGLRVPGEEPYLAEKALGICDLEFPYQVPENTYFLLGDQRKTSVDSRHSSVGCITDEDIVGKIVFRVWPLEKIGFVK